MCKLMIFGGITAETQQAALRFMKAAVVPMSESDKDGIGYAVSSLGTGELSGERWLNPRDAFKRRNPVTEREEALLEQLGLAVDVEHSYNNFGDLTAPFSACIMHTRMATTPVDLKNVHPFVKDDTALIHNGVISNHDQWKEKKSSCDSEAILLSYLECEVNKSPDAMQETADDLDGYYACGVFSLDNEGRRILDVFKSQTASLYVAWVKSLNTWVYCTTKDILRETCKRAKTTCSEPCAIKAGWVVRINPTTGEARSVTRFSPKARHVVGNFSGVNGYTGSYVGSRPYSHGWDFRGDEKKDDGSGKDSKLADKMDSPTAEKALSKFEETHCNECGEELLTAGVCPDPRCANFNFEKMSDMELNEAIESDMGLARLVLTEATKKETA